MFHDSASPIFQSVANTENKESSDSFEDFSAEETQYLSLAPSIGITGDAFVSQLPDTNWQAGVDLIVVSY